MGSLQVGAASSLGELVEGAWQEQLLAPARILVDLPAVTVDATTARAVGHGMQFTVSALGADLADGQVFAVLDEAGELLAVYRREGKKAAAEVVLA